MNVNTNEMVDEFKTTKICQRCGETKYRIINVSGESYQEVCAFCNELRSEE